MPEQRRYEPYGPELIIPQWPAPANVKAVSTTRLGGYSVLPFAGFNLGSHVGDVAETVQRNRQWLQQRADMPAAPFWLNQVHSATVVVLPGNQPVPAADAAFTGQRQQICTVMTADCLPVLFCDRQGTQVAAAHAGWRGLCDGVLENTLQHFTDAGQVLAWLGPAISQQAFEVGDEVREAFIRCQPEAAKAFISHTAGKWLADLYLLARLRLQDAGVYAIYGGEYCTYRQSELFFSYRRDGQTGRMASCIWLE